MYYRQLPCIYHPNLNITNFCQDQECLMPLCPSCIRQHTEYHQQIKTKPSYFNIYEALAETDTLITNYICSLEKDKKRNTEMTFKINRLPAIIHEKIQQAKTMAIKIVEQSFTQLQRDTLQAVQKINEQLNMHSIRKSEQLAESIVSNLQDLYDLAEGLKKESCLSDMIFFLKQKRFEVEDLHVEMTQYLYANQNYEPYVEINKEAQQSLAVVVHRMFKIDPKEKSNSSLRMNERYDEKGVLHQNAYHISLTPSKIKKPIYSLAKETSKYGPKLGQNSLSNNSITITSKPSNNSYQNYSQYQEQIQRSRQYSKQKNLRFGDEGTFRQLSYRERQRRVYHPFDEDTAKRTPPDTSRRGVGAAETKYGGLSKY